MCDAMSVGIGMQVAGTLTKGIAAGAQGRAAKSAADLNADIEGQAAADAIERGRLKDLQVAMRGDAVIAEQAIIQSGSGADVNAGGALQTRRASEAVLEIDRSVVRRNAAMEAYGIQAHERTTRQQGQDALQAGENAELGTFLGGMGTIIGEGGKIASDQGWFDTENNDSADIEE